MDIIIFLITTFLVILVLIFILWRKKQITNIQLLIALAGWVISFYLFGSTPLYVQEAGMQHAEVNVHLFRDYQVRLIPSTILTLALVMLFRPKNKP